MAAVTSIEWADSTLNFWIGCTKLSAACDHCYAEAEWATRRKRVIWGPHGDRSRTKTWAMALKWQREAAAFFAAHGRKRRVFVNSLSDWADNHKSIEPAWREAIWAAIRACPDIIFILLTKRPQNIARYLPPDWDQLASRVYLMTTVENDEEAGKRVDALLDSCRGRAQPAVFGLSMEPLLGFVDLTKWIKRLGWVIVGGESGPGARSMHPDWEHIIRAQCAAAGVPYLFKQHGDWAPWEPRHPAANVRYLDTDGSHRPSPSRSSHRPMVRVGKKAAGRQINGRTYDGFPEQEAA